MNYDAFAGVHDLHFRSRRRAVLRRAVSLHFERKLWRDPVVDSRQGLNTRRAAPVNS